MTAKSKVKKVVREVQRRTGWPYTRALYMVREKTPEEVEAAVAAVEAKGGGDARGSEAIGRGP